MKTLKLVNDDLAIENGDFAFTDEDIVQSAEILLKSNKGEWFFDKEQGLDFKKIFGKVSDGAVRHEVIQALSQEPEIKMIEEISVERKTDRQAEVTFRGKTESGEVEGQVNIGAI